jgi:hypothetical protein
VSIEPLSVSGNALWVELDVQPSGGPGAGYLMLLIRRGADTWRVGYFDTVLGPITPFVCHPWSSRGGGP